VSHRTALSVLSAAVLASMSCAVMSDVPSPAAPGHETSASLTAAANGTGATGAPPPDAVVTEVRAELDRRRTGLAADELDALAHAIVTEARRHHLDPALVMAVMHVESRFNNFALSSVGAMGLMQILPSTGEELAAKHGVAWYGPQTLFDPVANVRLGIAYLKELSDRFGNLSTALAAYNWGPGHIDRRIRRGRQLPRVYPRLVLDAHAAVQGRS
jgi:soluble lytic murein transglycosylase-like protein